METGDSSLLLLFSGLFGATSFTSLWVSSSCSTFWPPAFTSEVSLILISLDTRWPAALSNKSGLCLHAS